MVKSPLLFLIALVVSLFVGTQMSFALCNTYVAQMKAQSDIIREADKDACLNAEKLWRRLHSSLVQCITDNTPSGQTKVNSTVTTARSTLGKLISMELKGCALDKQQSGGWWNTTYSRPETTYATTNPDGFINNIKANLITPTVFDPSKTQQYNDLVAVRDRLQRFIDTNPDGDPTALKTASSELQRVERSLQALESRTGVTASDRTVANALASADQAISRANDILAQAIADNQQFMQEFPAVSQEAADLLKRTENFMNANANMPRAVAEEPAFTENQAVSQAFSELKRAMSLSVKDPAVIADLEKTLAAGGLDAAQFEFYERKLAKEMAKPTATEKEALVQQALQNLTDVIGAADPKTQDGKDALASLQSILGAGDLTGAQEDSLRTALQEVSSLSAGINRTISSLKKKLEAMKERRNLAGMKSVMAELAALLDKAEFSLDDYYAARNTAVTYSSSSDEEQVTLGKDRTDENSSQYYAMTDDLTGETAFMKYDALGNMQYSYKDDVGNTIYVASDSAGNQYMYITDTNGVTQYYVTDTAGNVYQVSSEVKYDRNSYKRVTSTDVITLPEAEKLTQEFLANNPEMANSSITYRLRRYLDYSLNLAQDKRDTERYALAYINKLLAEVHYLNFYQENAVALEQRYSSTLGKATIDPNTGMVGIGRTRIVAGDVGGELDVGLGLSADSLSDLFATSTNSYSVDGVSMIGASSDMKMGRNYMGDVTMMTYSKAKLISDDPLLNSVLDFALAGGVHDPNIAKDSATLDTEYQAATTLANEAATLKQTTGTGYSALVAAEMLAHEFLAANTSADPRLVARLQGQLSRTEELTSDRRLDDRYATTYARTLLTAIQSADVTIHNAENPGNRLSVRTATTISFTTVDGREVTVDTKASTAEIGGAVISTSTGVQNGATTLQSMIADSTVLTGTKAVGEVETLIDEAFVNAGNGVKGYGIGTDTTGGAVVVVGSVLGTISVNGVPTDPAVMEEATTAAISSSYTNRTGEVAEGYGAVDVGGITMHQKVPEVVDPAAQMTYAEFIQTVPGQYYQDNANLTSTNVDLLLLETGLTEGELFKRLTDKFAESAKAGLIQ